MASKSNDIPGERDLLEVLVKALSRSSEPKTVLQLRKDLTGPFRRSETELARLLRNLAARRRVHKWPTKARDKKPRYWAHEAEHYVHQQIQEVLGDKPLTVPQLKEALTNRLFGICATSRDGFIRSARKAEWLYEHPRVGRGGKKLSVCPPAPKPYLEKMLKEFDNACTKLAPAGLSKTAVLQAACELLGVGTAVAGEPTTGDVGQKILDAMRIVEPRARPGGGALVSLKRVRKYLALDKETFDRAVIDLANQDDIYLHEHTFPGGLDAKEREYLVEYRGHSYVGAVLGEIDK